MSAESLILIAAMAAAVLVTRIAAPLFFSRVGLPTWVGRWLKHVPVAVFSALVAPAVLSPAGRLDLSPANFNLLAGLITAAVIWRSGNFALAVAAGIVAVCSLRWLA